MKMTYKGSCHCGKIRYEADIDLDQGTGKCNCSICWKKRYWGAIVKPDDFRLQADDADVADYQFGSNSVHHRFCRTCGIAAYGSGYIEEIGGAYISVNVAALDDLDPAVLAAVPVQYMDGRNNNWFHAPAETRHL